MKVICKLHEQAHLLEEGCTYCTPDSTQKSQHIFPETLSDLINLAIMNSDIALEVMDNQFGTSWRNLDEAQLEKLLLTHFTKDVQLEIDYADFATVTND